MELSDIEAYNGVFSLHLRKSLEDGCHPIHTVSARSGDQDGLTISPDVDLESPPENIIWHEGSL
jgi:hypothetical protein